MASKGEIRVNQAKRGYEITDDTAEPSALGVSWSNPFYMRYAPDESGNFGGQSGYGYVSFEKFIDAVNELNAGNTTLDELDARRLPTLKNTLNTAAVLGAGRLSLNNGGQSVCISGSGEKMSFSLLTT